MVVFDEICVVGKVGFLYREGIPDSVDINVRYLCCDVPLCLAECVQPGAGDYSGERRVRVKITKLTRRSRAKRRRGRVKILIRPEDQISTYVHVAYVYGADGDLHEAGGVLFFAAALVKEHKIKHAVMEFADVK